MREKFSILFSLIEVFYLLTAILNNKKSKINKIFVSY